jgi:ankyrin repeat protein
LIENFGSAVESRSSTNKTPFHLACIRGEEKLIKFMILKGANGASVDRDGSTPLHYLCETENLDMVRYLLPLSDGSKDIRNRFGKKPVDLIQDNEMKKLIRNYKVRRNTSQSNSRGRLINARNSLGSKERQS